MVTWLINPNGEGGFFTYAVHNSSARWQISLLNTNTGKFFLAIPTHEYSQVPRFFFQVANHPQIKITQLPDYHEKE